jgi:hypothetical protein
MRRIRGFLLAFGLAAAVPCSARAQLDPTSRTPDGFGPILVDSWSRNGYRPLPVYRDPYAGPFAAHLDALGAKMRQAGMQGGLPPLYIGPSGSGYGVYGLGFSRSGGALTSPLYHPVSASTEPNLYYDPVFNAMPGAPSPEVASRGWGYSPPWSKAYRGGETRKHKLFSHLHHKD